MADDQILADFGGRIVIVGFGSIGQGILPLILRHLAVLPSAVTIVAADAAGEQVAARHGVRLVREALTPDNYRRRLEPLVARGDFLLNVSVAVSSVALIGYARERGALYLDTCIEPWPGGYTDPDIPAAARTNYALREEVLALRAGESTAPTAVVTHGANPGLVSHFVKRALLDVAADTGVGSGPCHTRQAWAELASRLDVRTIHIAERDTQVSVQRKQANEFVNTWSVEGFVSEAQQPCEIGWGSHEKHFPPDGHQHPAGSRAAIYLSRPGCATRVRSWTPRCGPYHGFAITHGEAISIADYLTLRRDGEVCYRPTVHYAYHPCDDALLSVHEFCGRNYRLQAGKRILVDDIVAGGVDELGVLLAGHARNAYWFGSVLSVDEARQLAAHNSATTLQVTAAALAGMVWAIENPERGVVEPDEMDFARILDLCAPYLGPVVGAYSDWTPLTDRQRLFAEDLDPVDPWQFKNVRVC